jgi:hypothetical protein
MNTSSDWHQAFDTSLFAAVRLDRAFLQAQLPDPVTGQPALDALPRFLDSHPTARAFLERLSQKPVPASYGQVSCVGVPLWEGTIADELQGQYGRQTHTLQRTLPEREATSGDAPGHTGPAPQEGAS